MNLKIEIKQNTQNTGVDLLADAAAFSSAPNSLNRHRPCNNVLNG
jgi:hypothetical protein